MKAVVVREFSEPQEYLLAELPDPIPGYGEMRVTVHSAAINFGDTLISTGRYQVRPHLPFTPGAEFSGTVESVGEGVREFKPGDHIAAMGFVGDSRVGRKIMGACAEMAIVPVRNAVRVPHNIDLEQASLIRSNTETAFFALQQAKLAPGEALLVMGAAGGTGFAAVSLGKLLGARVIASVSSKAKQEIALAAGADVAIDSNSTDWRQQVNGFAGNDGVSVVYDPVGGDYTERAFRTLGYGGRHLIIGFAAGEIPNLPVNLALMKASSLVGANLLRAWEHEPDRIAENANKIMQWASEGRIKTPPIAKRYSLAETKNAFEDVASGKIAGRVVISIGAAE